MSSQSTIIVIHADDSDQHSGHLKRILDALKNENRIKSYIAHDSNTITSSTFNSLLDNDTVILLLTAGLEQGKSTIEEYLLNLKKSRPGVKIIEIIIDHIPYEPEFIALPTDLQPIRSREDMDATWKQIEDSLRSIYPAIPVEVAKADSSKLKRFIPFVLGFIVLIAIIFAIKEFMSGNDKKADTEVEAFGITEVVAVVKEPVNYRGECPHKFRFEAKITSNGPGDISYSWVKNDGTKSTEQHLEFTEAGTQTIATTWELGGNRGDSGSYWQQLVISAPEEKRSNRAEVTVECITPIAENCLEFDNSTHTVDEFTITGRGKVYSVSYDAQSILGFRDAAKMVLAKDIVEFYGFNTFCYTRRINAGLRYFKTGNTLPSGGFPGEDCMRIIDPTDVGLGRNPANNTYSVRDGGSGKFLFTGISKSEADKIIEVIKYYKPKYKCTVGTQEQGMMYMRY